MGLGVAAFLVLLPSMSDACQVAETHATARVERAVSAGSRVLVIGDSYTAGRGSFDGRTGWAQILSARAGWDSTIDGRPGTGYVNPGATGSALNTYLPRVVAQADEDPDLVIVQGSQNDWTVDASTLRQRVEQTLSRAVEQWPRAVVVAIGPSAPQPRAASTGAIDAAVRAGARAADVPYIDPYRERWFTSANSGAYAAADGEHLDDDGHRYLAGRIDSALRTAGTAEASACRSS
jgi:lysophospholipase L1-like esterase